MDQLTSTHSGTDEKANEIDTMNTAEKLPMGGKGKKRRGVSTAKNNVSKTAPPLILVCPYKFPSTEADISYIIP